MELLVARHPDRLDATNAIIIDEFITLNATGKNAAVTQMIAMLTELRKHGRACRYLKNLTGVSLKELKPRARGGMRGGARIYLWLLPDDFAAVINCEVKEPGASPNIQTLKTAVAIFVAHQKGIPVLSRHPTL